MDRRSVLKGGFVLAATAHTAVGMAVASETQEEKCARLLEELLAECRQLPAPGRSRYGDYADISMARGGHVRYGLSADGTGEMLTVVL